MPGLALPVSLIKRYFVFLQNKAVKVVSEVFDPEVRCFSLTCLPRDLYRGGGEGGWLHFTWTLIGWSVHFLQSAGCPEGPREATGLAPVAVM